MTRTAGGKSRTRSSAPVDLRRQRPAGEQLLTASAHAAPRANVDELTDAASK